jgi:hypothetical protein
MLHPYAGRKNKEKVKYTIEARIQDRGEMYQYYCTERKEGSTKS